MFDHCQKLKPLESNKLFLFNLLYFFGHLIPYHFLMEFKLK